MSKKTIVTTVALVASLIIGAGSVYARVGGHNNGHWNGDHNAGYGHNNNYRHNNGIGHGYQNGHYGQGVQGNVNLTDAQITSLEELENEYVAQVNPMRQRLAVKVAEYNAVMNGQNPNPTEAGEIAGEIETIRQDLQRINNDYAQTVEDETGIAMGGRYHHNGYHN